MYGLTYPASAVITLRQINLPAARLLALVPSLLACDLSASQQQQVLTAVVIHHPAPIK
jgi:hypothetical protein